MHIIYNPRNHYYCVHRIITIDFLLFYYVEGTFILNILHKILEYFYNNYDCTNYTYVELSLPLFQLLVACRDWCYKYIMNTQGENIVVLSANSRGLQDARKREDVLNYYKELDPNILCLQDTNWTDKNVPDIKRIWNGEIVINGSSTNSRGIAILFSKKFEYEITNINNDTNENLLDININTNDLKIINIYAPNTDSPEFFSE